MDLIIRRTIYVCRLTNIYEAITAGVSVYSAATVRLIALRLLPAMSPINATSIHLRTVIDDYIQCVYSAHIPI